MPSSRIAGLYWENVYLIGCSAITYFNYVLYLVAQSCLTLCDPMDYTVHVINSSGQNTGVGSLSLFQGIFPTQG